MTLPLLTEVQLVALELAASALHHQALSSTTVTMEEDQTMLVPQDLITVHQVDLITTPGHQAQELITAQVTQD